MSETSWLEKLRASAEQSPDAVAITEVGGRSITRSELSTMIGQVMHSLENEGFEAGDVVLFSVKPGIDAIALVLAMHELRGVLLPMDPGVCDTLFAARMSLLKPRWVFAQGILLSPPRGVLMSVLRTSGVQFAPLGEVAGARYIHVGMRFPGAPPSTSFRSLLSGRRAEVARRRTSTSSLNASHGRRAGSIDEKAPSFIVCTSGTTAHPKAVVHSRRSLQATVHAIGNELRLSPDDVMYARELHLALPALFAGARLVIPRDSSFDARRTLRAMGREGVTHAFLVTRDCRLLLDECVASGERVPDSLRSLMIGAAPVRAPFLARLREVLPSHTVAWCVYGATEVLPVASVSLEEKLAYGGAGDLVGRVITGLSVRTDEGGQLCITGDRLFSGYAGEHPVTEHLSGDLATIDGDRIVLLGRAKDMIIRGEHNIYPALYEPLVERVPGVRRAAMIGDFDATLADERVILVVEPEQGASPADVLERVSRSVRHGPFRLDSSAQPDRIVLHTIPESGRSHKIDKGRLRLELRTSGPA